MRKQMLESFFPFLFISSEKEQLQSGFIIVYRFFPFLFISSEKEQLQSGFIIVYRFRW